MVNMPNLHAISALGSQFTKNVFAGTAQHFQSKTKRALRQRTSQSQRANTAARTQPSTPSSHTPQGLPEPSAAMGEQLQAGRVARAQRAQSNRQNAGPNLANRINYGTPTEGGAKLNYQGPTPVRGDAHLGATSAQASSFVSRINSQAGNPVHAVQPAQFGGGHRASAPTNMTVSHAPGTGRHRAGGTPNVAPKKSVQAAPVASQAHVTTLGQQFGSPGRVSGTTPLAGSREYGAMPSPHQEAQRRLGTRGYESFTARKLSPSEGASSPAHPNFGSNPVAAAPQKKNIPNVDTSTKSNAPFPTHVNPEGASSQKLQRLSATETAKTGRENEFTVGSRNPSKVTTNIRGLAAKGSQLEASLNSRPFQTPAKSAPSAPEPVKKSTSIQNQTQQRGMFSAAPYRVAKTAQPRPKKQAAPKPDPNQGTLF